MRRISSRSYAQIVLKVALQAEDVGKSNEKTAIHKINQYVSEYCRLNSLDPAKSLTHDLQINATKLRILIRLYEENSHTHIKSYATTPIDIDKVPYNPSQPSGDTIGNKLDKLGSLADLFKATRSKPPVENKPKDPSHQTGWFTGKNITLALLQELISIFSYRLLSTKDTAAPGESTIPAVAAV